MSDLEALRPKTHKITAKINTYGQGEVTIDGINLSCKEFKVDAGIDKFTTVDLKLILCDVDLEIEQAEVNYADPE